MNLVGFISTAVLSLTLVAAAPMYAQEQHGQDEQKAKPEEKKAQPEKSAKQEQKPVAQQEKNAKQEEKSAQQQDKNTKQEEKSAQQQQGRPEPQAQRASGSRSRIPDDRFKANFGEQHRFRVSHADYDNHRFQYGGYWFGFVDPWPSNWLYTQDVFVVEIDGVYYLCNAMYPGINITLSFAL